MQRPTPAVLRHLPTILLSITLSAAAHAQNSITYIPVITTYAGSNVSGNTGDNGQATLATFGNPVATAYDSAGNVYITDKGKGTVRKVTLATGVITTVAGTGTVGTGTDGVAATTSKLNGPNESWVDPAGNIYIADTTNNRIRKVTASTGIITTIAGNGTAGFAGDGAVANSTTTMISGPNAVCLDAAGNIFVGDSGSQRIRKIDAVTGIINTIAGNGVGKELGDGGLASASEEAGPRYLFPDVNGNLYLVDRTDHVVREIIGASSATPGIIKLIAGSPTAAAGSTGDGGLATSAIMNTPNAVAVDAVGNIYIIDSTANALRVINSVTGIIYTLAGGNTTGASAGDGGLSTNSSLNVPLGVGFSPGGNIDIGDSSSFIVRRTTLGNSFPATAVGATSAAQKNGIEAITATTINSFGLSHTSPADFTVGAITGCTLPAAVAIDGVCGITASFAPTAPGLRTSQLLAVDSSSNKYLLGLSGVGNAPAVAIGTGLIATTAGTGTAGSTGDGAAATAAKLNGPGGLALDSTGNLYLADTVNNKVRVVTASTGIISTFAGTGTASNTGDGAAANAATLSAPSGLALDPTGNLYIADSGNSAIRMVTTQNGLISTVPGTTGIFSGAKGVALDAAGLNLYVADTGNHVIRRVNLPTGYVYVVAGTAGSSGFGGDNGLATAATLKSPAGVTLDTAGNIYIADTGNNVIRKITASSGVITTIAGNGTAAATGDGAAATLASLNAPTRVTVDPAGDLFIADAGNNKVRYVSAATGFITTAAGTGTAATPFTGDGAAATAATLNKPGDIVLDQFANLYIADTSDNRIALVNQTTTTLNFGSTDPNTTTAAQIASVTNFGNTTLTLSKIVTTTAYAQTSSGGTDCSATTSLAPGATCLIAIKFTPTASITYNGSVTITDNALNNTASTQTITLTGIGNSVSVPASLTATAGNNQTVTPLQTFPIAFQATVKDATSVGISGVNVTFTAPSTGATGTFANGTNTVTVKSGAGGVATATAFTAGATRGAFAVAATIASPALSATFSETIAGNPTPAVVVTFTPASPQVYGQPITLKATLTPSSLGGTNIGGTVSFFDNASSTAFATANVNAGVATYSYTPTAGSHSYSATYSGDANFSTSSSTVPAALTVTPLGITAAANSITIPYGTSPVPTLTGTLNGVLAADAANVTPAFSAGITPTTNVGTYNISTTLTGSAASNYTVTSTTGTVTITQAGTSNSLSTPTLNPGFNTAVSITDTIVSNTTGTPGGSVNFYDGGTSGTLLGTKVPAGGVATLSISTLSVGTHIITAVYSGNTNFLGSPSSNSLTIVVSIPDYSLSLSSNTVTVKQGQQGMLTTTLSVVGGFTGTIASACTGLPANATCTFTPATFTPTSTVLSQTGLLVISTGGPSLTATNRHSNTLPLFASLFGLTLLALRRKYAARFRALAMLLAIGCFAGALSGCGNSVNPLSAVVTPVGTSTVTVTSTSTTLAHTATFTLNVTAAQ